MSNEACNYRIFGVNVPPVPENVFQAEFIRDKLDPERIKLLADNEI